MRPILCSFAIFALAFQIALAQGHQRHVDHVLDLVVNSPSKDAKTMAAEERDLRRWLPPPPPADSRPASKFPFEVTLTSVDLQTYAVGERIRFELLMRNISTRAIAFPWSLDAGSFMASMRGARRLELALNFVHPIIGHQHFAWQRVFGSDEVPGSLRTIQPNESVLIRADGPIELRRASMRPLEETWVHDVDVKADIVLAVPSKYYPPTTSQNEISIQLRSK
jgi:hypothetical protein